MTGCVYQSVVHVCNTFHDSAIGVVGPLAGWRGFPMQSCDPQPESALQQVHLAILSYELGNLAPETISHSVGAT